MKYEERLTQWVGDGASLILDNPRNVEEAKAQLQDKFKMACIKLAELEDRIERGELVSTVQSEQNEQEIAFFAKHDVEVCKEVVKECLQVLRDTRVACIYDDYLWGWNKGIDQAIEQLAKEYCIPTRKWQRNSKRHRRKT